MGVVAMCLPGTTEVVARRAETEGLPKVSRRALIGGAGAAAAVAAIPRAAVAGQRKRPKRVQDLTHLFREGFPVYTGAAPAREDLFTVEDNGFYSQEWTFGEHSGTHMDAPGHFISGGRRAPEITVRELLIPIVVIDISRKASRDPDSVVTADDIMRFERRHGRIPAPAGVFMDSGWADRVDDPDAFKNADSSGTYHFPGFGLEAVEF